MNYFNLENESQIEIWKVWFSVCVYNVEVFDKFTNNKTLHAHRHLHEKANNKLKCFLCINAGNHILVHIHTHTHI